MLASCDRMRPSPSLDHLAQSLATSPFIRANSCRSSVPGSVNAVYGVAPRLVDGARRTPRPVVSSPDARSSSRSLHLQIDGAYCTSRTWPQPVVGGCYDE